MTVQIPRRRSALLAVALIVTGVVASGLAISTLLRPAAHASLPAPVAQGGAATVPSDEAFVRQISSELAFNNGQDATALRQHKLAWLPIPPTRPCSNPKLKPKPRSG